MGPPIQYPPSLNHKVQFGFFNEPLTSDQNHPEVDRLDVYIEKFW